MNQLRSYQGEILLDSASQPLHLAMVGHDECLNLMTSSPSGPDSYATKFLRVCKYKDNDQLLQMTLTSSVLTLMLGGIQQGLRGMTWASTGVS